jgi:hypothetical protein
MTAACHLCHARPAGTLGTAAQGAGAIVLAFGVVIAAFMATLVYATRSMTVLLGEFLRLAAVTLRAVAAVVLVVLLAVILLLHH